MKTFNIALVLVAASFHFLGKADADECHDFVKGMLSQQLKFVVPCIEKLGLKTPDEKKGRVYCIMRCVLQDADWLAKDGTVDFDLVSKALATVPESMKDKANGVFTECGHHAASLDPAEASCESYAPLITCLTDVSVKLC